MDRKKFTHQPFFLGLAFFVILNCSPSTPPSPFPSSPPSLSTQEQKPLPLPYSLGVLPFDSHGEVPRLTWLRDGLPDMLITDLATWTGVDIVSRQSLGEVLREQWIQHRGMTEPGSAVRLGQMSGARYLLKGSFIVVKSQIIVDVHLLDVEYGLVVRTGRITESLENVPALARQLANQIGGFFGSRPVTQLHDELRNKDETISKSLPSNDTIPEQLPSTPPVHSVDNHRRPQSQILPADILLRRDRTQRLREEAWLVADEIWQKGLSIDLGPPGFLEEVPSRGESGIQGTISIPVSSFFQYDRLRLIHPMVVISRLNASRESLDHGMISWKSDDLVTRKLFLERLRSPRRLFVRAISLGGKVIGVASNWSWRLEHTLEERRNGSIKVPVAPTPALVGEVEFSTMILVGHKAIDHFDAVVVTVPEEDRMVSIETVWPLEEKQTSDSTDSGHMTRIHSELKQWFHENWKPRVAESLPVEGYLPGNRRTVQIFISGHNGRVDEARISQKPNEDLLLTDTRHLLAQLREQCFFRCLENLSESSDAIKEFTVRVQLDLVKDLQFVGLGTMAN